MNLSSSTFAGMADGGNVNVTSGVDKNEVLTLLKNSGLGPN
jgi:hypothetical protein